MNELDEICARLLHDSNALTVLLIDKDSRVLAQAGDEKLDAESLSTLFAGVARLLAEKEFSGPFQQGAKRYFHVSPVAQRAVLAVVFDLRSSLGLVRLRVKKAIESLQRALDRGPEGSPAPAAAPGGLLFYKPRKNG